MGVRQNDIAEELGVSVSTVSLALRNSPQVSERTRLEIVDAATRLGYQRRMRRVSRPNGAIRQITFTMRFNPSNPFYVGVLGGAESECRRHRIALHYTQMDDLAQEALHQCAQSDAILLVGGFDEETVLKFKELDPPLVLVDNNLPHLELDRVLTENVGSLYRLVAKMVEWGHKRIGFMGNPDVATSFSERQEGYLRAISAYGLEPVMLGCGDFPTAGAAEEEMKEYLRGHKRLPFTALICANDAMAIEVMHALQHAGIDVPNDVSLVGFDGVDLGRIVRPTLTTTQVQRELMGQLGVRLLLDRARNPSAPAQAIVLDTTFIERGSARSLR